MCAGKPLRLGDVVLVPIERRVLQAHTFTAHTWFAASSEPVALIVQHADDIRTIGIGREVSLEQLREQIPELDKLIPHG